MSRLAEASLFLSLAAAIHVGAFTAVSNGGDGTGGGDAGEAQVTLAAASGAVIELVESWQRPPETALKTAAMRAPADLSEALPDIRRDSRVARPTQPLLAALPLAPQTPELDTRLPAVPVTDVPPEQPEAANRPEAPDQPQPKPDNAPRAEAPVRPAPPEAPTAPQADTRTAEEPAPKPKPKPAQPPQRATASAGTSGGPVAGQSNAAPSTATLSVGQQKTLLAGWGAQIKKQVLRRKSYPRGTTATGTAALRVTVARNGQLAGVSLHDSSGNASLDKAALRAVSTAGRFPAAPDGLTKAQYSFTLALTFSR